jgi:hypothetical protein
MWGLWDRDYPLAARDVAAPPPYPSAPGALGTMGEVYPTRDANMVPLTHHDIFMLQLSVERWIADNNKRRRVAAKVGDKDALSEIEDISADLDQVRAKLNQMRG